MVINHLLNGMMLQVYTLVGCQIPDNIQIITLLGAGLPSWVNLQFSTFPKSIWEGVPHHNLYIRELLISRSWEP